MLLAEILVILAGILFLFAAVWLGKRQEPESNAYQAPPPGFDLSAEHATKLQASLTELLQELQALSRDIAGDLEEKLSELKELLQSADTRLEDLHLAERESSDSDQARLEKTSPELELQITVEDDDIPPISERHEQVYRMADAGLSIDEIARQMEMGKGEIQLILSLRKKD